MAGEAAPELTCRALLQIARLRHEQSDMLYEQILTQCTDEEVRGLAALVLGRRYRQAGRGDKARQVLESIAPPQPQYTHAQMELAQLYVEEGKADEAIALIARQVAADAECRAYRAVGAVASGARRTRVGSAPVARGPAAVGGGYGGSSAGGIGLELVQDRALRGRVGRVGEGLAEGCVGWRPAARSVAGYERVCPDLGGQPAHGSSLSRYGCE